MARRRRSILVLCLVTTWITPLNFASGQETINYSYDERGRLVQVTRAGTVNNGVAATYQYDKADNRTNVTVTGGGPPASPTLSVADVSATEGQILAFVVTRSGDTSAAVTVDYATSNGTATSGSDYTGASNSLTFAIGETSKTVNISTVDDSTAESSETVNLTLSNPSGATISDGSAVGTITDNDSTSPCSGVTFSVSSNGAITEGTSSGFTVSKSGSTSSSCTVDYATANGTAVAPGDYTAKSTTTLTYTSSQTSKTVNVTTIDDSSVENAETFTLNLSSPSGGATMGTGTATATINDNDTSQPCSGVSFRVGDAAQDEGDTVSVTISKDGTATGSCSVSYATANNTAVAPGDYVAVALTALTFTTGEIAKTINIVLKNDQLAESNETLFVNLSSPTGGATISDSQALITIINFNSQQCFENGIPVPCEMLTEPPPDEETSAEAIEGTIEESGEEE